MSRAALGAAVAILLALAGGASAAELSVGSGAAFDLGTGSLDLGCANLAVAGTLSAGSVGLGPTGHVSIDPSGTVNGDSATLEVGGDWNKAATGIFNAGTSTVRFVDDCNPSSVVITGDTTFANLDMTTTLGKEYQLTAGSTQTVTSSLALLGTAGNPLTIRSTVGGSAAFLDLQGSHSADFVDVQDNDATAGNPIALGANSVKGSNTPGWIQVVVPALGALGLTLLALSLLWSGRRAVAGRITGRWKPGAARGAP